MWMMDHIMNARLSARLSAKVLCAFPLKTSPNIMPMPTRWRRIGPNVLAPEKCSYILGNPPFEGALSETQRSSVKSK